METTSKSPDKTRYQVIFGWLKFVLINALAFAIWVVFKGLWIGIGYYLLLSALVYLRKTKGAGWRTVCAFAILLVLVEEAGHYWLGR